MVKVKKSDLTRDQLAIMLMWFPYLLEDDEEEEKEEEDGLLHC